MVKLKTYPNLKIFATKNLSHINCYHQDTHYTYLPGSTLSVHSSNVEQDRTLEWNIKDDDKCVNVNDKNHNLCYKICTLHMYLEDRTTIGASMYSTVFV